MVTKELIEKIVQDYHACGEVAERPTFLEIIGKTRREDYITDLLAYALKTEPFILERLVQIFYKDAEDFCDIIIEDIVSQKYMEEEGRADIFIIAETGQGNRCVIIIENKTDTMEHSDQTTKYARWAEKYYSDCRKYLFFLKPDYNQGKAANKQYKNINYSQLAPLLGESEDVYIADLKRHIEKYLTEEEMKFMGYEKLILEHYEDLKIILDNVKGKFERGKSDLIKKLEEDREGGIIGFKGRLWKENDMTQGDEILLWITNSKKTFHFTKKEWYRKHEVDPQDDYYFYAEIKFNDNSINKIVCQKTVRVDKKISNKKLKKFLKYKGEAGRLVSWSGWDYTILSECFFESEKECGSLEWWEELRVFTSKAINGYLKELDNLVKEFLVWDGN